MLKRYFEQCFLFASVIIACAAHSHAQAASINVAVASNFRNTVELLAPIFEQASGHIIRLRSASTGVLYQQILHGADIDIFLAADNERPKMLVDAKFAQDLAPYATGRLLLIGQRLPADTSQKPDNIVSKQALTRILANAPKRSVALAKPNTAPYGLAAKQVYQQLNLWDSTKKSRVETGNIAQAALLLDQGHVQYAFLAASIAQQIPDFGTRRIFNIPNSLHTPITQSAVLLNKSKQPSASREFLTFLSSPKAQKIIAAQGYDQP